MALQTQDLVMVGLGVIEDQPLNDIQPALVDGIHLRWAFNPERGFPWYGYYLFRRQHRIGQLTYLQQLLDPSLLYNISEEEKILNLPGNRRLIGYPFLRLSDDFPGGGNGKVEFDLESSDALYLRFAPEETVRRVDVTLGFRHDSEIELSAMMGNVPVVQTRAIGRADDIISVTLEFDAISAVKIESGPAALIDIGFIAVAQEATKGWELLEDFRYPLHLPVLHPDYPCAPENEHLPMARELTESRILYGRPDEFLQSECTHGNGTISVVHGSPIVTGSAGNWGDDLTGSMLSVEGDFTAYTIIRVISPTKLVLSRGYAGVSRNGLSYEICTDTFTKLHDHLVQLVSGGPGSTRMVDRSLPAPVYTSGSISVEYGSNIVQGHGTNWPPDLSGLNFQIEPSQPDDNEPVYTITAIDSSDRIRLDRPYRGESDTGKPYKIFAALMANKEGEETPRMPGQHPLYLVLLSALHPAVAQMLGLYWVDRTAEPGIAYDYLILADHTNYFRGNPERIFSAFEEGIFPNLNGYIVFNKKLERPAPLAPPNDLRAYSLPGCFLYRPEEQTLIDAQNNAGLVWDLGVKGGAILPGKPVMYHVWRTAGSEQEPTRPPSTYQFHLLTRDRPVLIPQPKAYKPPKSPSWPPCMLYYIDRALEDGWYSYQVSGIDIFGRHSRNSLAARWHQWGPVPAPRPWYYKDPPGDRVIHDFAIRLLDKLPPPPPAGIEASVLDPADPTVLHDEAYKNWRASLSPAERETLVGLRVSWLWTPAQQHQAPDTREFRIYYQPASLNSISGHTKAARNVSETIYEVTTDIPNTLQANAYRGARLHIGTESFTIVGNDAESLLKVQVKVHPVYNKGTVAVSGGSNIVEVSNANVSKDQLGLAFKVSDQKAVYTILDVDPSKQTLILDRGYEGVEDSVKSYTISGKLPLADKTCNITIPSPYTVGKVEVSDGSRIVNGTDSAWYKELSGNVFQIAGEWETYTITTVDSETQLTLDRPYQGPTKRERAYFITHPSFVDYNAATNWKKRIFVMGYNEYVTEIGPSTQNFTTRKYEVFLPVPDDIQFQPCTESPIVYANIGVSAVDDKRHTLDDPKWAKGGWGGEERYGNEGPVGGLRTIVRVHRKQPDPPVPPPDSEKVYASLPDYYGHAFYTYRWQPMPYLKTHIFRALDDTLFKVDWAQRSENNMLLLDPGNDKHIKYFPADWNANKHQPVADELNKLNTFTDKVQAMEYYRNLSNDALRVLAGLPGNERAFTQVTIRPLEPEEPDPDEPGKLKWRDRIGPDSDPNYSPQKSLRAYVDTLDGRAANRYFYRSAYVDGAHNISELSLSSPPVWLRNVVPPRAPVITKVLGGDREITFRWASNREPELKEYWIYRTQDKDAARDIRLMGEPVDKISVQAGEPTNRPEEVEWPDKAVQGLVNYYYRVVAVDDAGNVSPPSPVKAARAYDDNRPDPPTWNQAVAGPTPDSLLLSWQSQLSDLTCLVQRRISGETAWTNISSWLPRGSYTFTDTQRSPGAKYDYRLKVLDTQGRGNKNFKILLSF